MTLKECRTSKDKQLFAMEFHGIECQQKKLVEEVHELNEAITRLETKRQDGFVMTPKKEVVSELADVKNLLEQIQNFYNIDTLEINDEKRKKIERHFKEIKYEIEHGHSIKLDRNN